MKRSYTFLAAVLVAANMWAQSPQKISYQAVIRDSDSKLVTTQVGMQISILAGSHTHTPDIATFNSGSTGSSTDMNVLQPYIVLNFERSTEHSWQLASLRPISA